MNLSRWPDRVIRIGFYLLFGLVPLLLTPWNYELFEYNKTMMVYGITILVSAGWLIKMIHEKEVRIAKTPLDIPIALFVSSQFVSSLLSIDPHVSWFGYYSRFNGGMWSILSYVLLYYAFVSNVTNWSGWTNMLKVAVTTGTIVAFYGVAERLGIDKNLWVQDVQNRVFSTLGQPNWLAAYVVGLSPIAMAFAVVIKNRLRILHYIWITISILFFIVLLFTKSRSGLLGFAIADILFWGILLMKERKVHLKKLAILVHVVFALIVFFNGTNIPTVDNWTTFRGLRTRIFSPANTAVPEAAPSAQTGPALESGGTESGVIRKYVWQGAITAWQSSLKTKLVGTGTETFAFAFYQYRPKEHNLTSEWDFLYNKAHNEYLNYLTTTGAFGLGSYLLIISAFVWWFVKKVHTMNDERLTISVALFAGWVSILVTNFFGFSVVITQCMFFLFPAFAFALGSKETTRNVKLNPPSWLSWIILIAAIYLLFVVGKFWYADTQFASGYRLNRAEEHAAALPALLKAAHLNGQEPLYHDELGSLYATVAVGAYTAGDATSAAEFMRASIREQDIAITTSPANVNFWKTRTKIYVAMSAIDPQFMQLAIDALTHALTLSPNDPKILYNLAILHGRLGDGDMSVDYLQQAIAMKPNYRDAYFALSVFYTELQKPQEARNILEEYLTRVDPDDKDFQQRLQ